MKIVHFSAAPGNTSGSNTFGIINRFRSFGHEVIYYDFWNDSSEVNKIKTRHFQMYEGALNFSEKVNADLVLFEDNLGVPEYLLSELKIRPNYKHKIVFFMLLREVNKSLARATVIKELLNMSQIHKVITTTRLTGEIKLPDNLIKANIGDGIKKFSFVVGPYSEVPESYDISKKEARTKFNLDSNEFILLYSGRWWYIRGADIFVEALKYIDKNIKVVIQYIPILTDLQEDTLEQAKKNHENTIFIKKFFEFGGDQKGEIAPLFVASDLVIASHRKSYEYGESSVFQAAFYAKRPVVAPNFYFFNEIVKRYNAGVLYEAENPIAMADAINYCRKHYDEIISNVKFEEAVKGHTSHACWADTALDGLGEGNV
jgi:glycosyltransferase involved in cell wall biosynthesis